MKKSRILITTSTYPRWKDDSTPSFVKHLAEGLAKDASEVVVLAPHAKGAKTSEKDEGVQVKRFRYFLPASAQNITYSGGGVDKIKKTPLYAFKLVIFMASLLIHTLWYSVVYRIDVLNPHWAVPQGFVAVLVKFLTGKRVVLTVHGGDVFSLNSRIMLGFKKFTLKHSDEVCVNSNATMKRCKEIYDRDYHVIPMGVHMDKFEIKNRATTALADSPFEILYVGRFAEVKGVEYLMQALALLSARGVKYHATIAGDGGLREGLETYVAEEGISSSVTFPGWIAYDKLKELFGTADVFVGPSLSEAQGLVFVEALATGTPVIGSDVGGIPDVVQDGKNGYLVEARNPEQICEKIQYLIENPKVLSKLRNNARHSVLEKFSWKTVVGAYTRVMNGEK